MAADAPRPPKGLTSGARKLWKAVVVDYDCAAHDLAVLETACRAWDRMTAAGAVIDAEGATYLDRFEQPKVRPEVAIERDARIGFLRAMRQLGLEAGDPDEVRPPANARLRAIGSW